MFLLHRVGRYIIKPAPSYKNLRFSDFIKEVKAFLSSQSISSHVSILTMGCIPVIKSQELKLSVEKMAQVTPETINFTQVQPSDGDSISSKAEQATRKTSLNNQQNIRVKEILQTMGKIDYGNSSTLDMNTLFTAFENYVTNITSQTNSIGVPIHSYITNLSKREIIDLWRKKNPLNLR